MITHVIFDIDGTLLDESASLEAQTSAVAWKFGDSVKERQAVVDAFFAANDRAVAEGGQAKNNITQYMKWMGESLGVVVSDIESVKLAREWSEAFAGTFTKPQVFSDSVACLEALKARGVQCVAASGGTKVKKQLLLAEAGLADYFDAVYAATDIGFQKQDVRFWQTLLTKLEVASEQCLVVGNQINDDIMHPKTLGMSTVLVVREGLLRKDLGPKEVQADYTIKTLDELNVATR